MTQIGKKKHAFREFLVNVMLKILITKKNVKVTNRKGKK